MKIGNISISITNRCNYRCKHCSFDSGEKRITECSSLEWADFLKDARILGAEKVDITGGEPTLRKDLEEIIAEAKSLSYKVKLLTNGSHLTNYRLERLKYSGLDAIAISLDGSTSEVHNYIRLKDNADFEGILGAIKRSLQHGFFTKVNTVVFSSNLDDIPNIISLVESLKVDEHRICYFTPTGRGKSLLNNLDSVRWLSFIRQNLARFIDNDRLYIGTSHLERINELETSCYLNLGTAPLHVLPNGDIYACSIQTSTTKPIGNIKERQLKECLSKIPYIDRCCFDFKDSSNEDLCQVCPLRKFRLKEII